MPEEIKIVGRDALKDAPRTAGMVRSEAFAEAGLWMGEIHTEAGAISGWHHHGDYTTHGYVISGRLHFDFGPGGKQSVEAGPGEFFVVPPHTVHREGNPGSEEQVLVGVRTGTGPTVINVDGPDAG